MDVYRHLTSWVPLHMDWISVVGKDFIAEQKLRPEDYANNIINPDIPMDELGLLIIARMYHMHFGVVMNDHVWNTTDDNSAKVDKFKFMYCGDNRFLDTCTGNWNLPSPPSLLLDISRSEQLSPINLAGGEEGQKITQRTNFVVPLDLRNLNEIETDKEHETDSEDRKVDENQKMDIAVDPKAEEKHETDTPKMDIDDKNQEKDSESQKMDIAVDQKPEEKHETDTEDPKMDIEDKNQEKDSESQKMDIALDQKAEEKHETDNEDPKLDIEDKNQEKDAEKDDQNMDIEDPEPDDKIEVDPKKDSVSEEKDLKRKSSARKMDNSRKSR